MPRDLIHLFCQDTGSQLFAGDLCRFYLSLSTECRLLKGDELREIFALGRCAPVTMVERSVQINLYEYADHIHPPDYAASVSFEVVESMKPVRLKKGFTLYVLKGYINIAAYRKVREILEKEGILTRRECGHCVHLSPAKPHSCQRMTVLAHEGEQENPVFEQVRRPSDRACQGGFEAFTFEDAEWREPVDASVVNTTIVVGAALLHDRAEHAAGETKKRYERQYVVFCKCIQWLGDDRAWDEEKSRIAETFGISLKTLERDILEILRVLETHDVV